MIGQKQIHQRIQQLNFRDCHAKIAQVDAQATLGDGVVVQVTGELSNAGQPMRRFTQTFVLAAQSPKKYYVHNDIFRYQVSDQFDCDVICNDNANYKCKYLCKIIFRMKLFLMKSVKEILDRMLKMKLTAQTLQKVSLSTNNLFLITVRIMHLLCKLHSLLHPTIMYNLPLT